MIRRQAHPLPRRRVHHVILKQDEAVAAIQDPCVRVALLVVFVHVQVAFEIAGDLARHRWPDKEFRGLRLIRPHKDASHRDRVEVRAQVAARVHDVTPLPADAARHDEGARQQKG